MERIKRYGLAVLAVGFAAAMVAVASTPTGVTPTLIGRGTYQPFKVGSMNHASAVDFTARAKQPVDMVVRIHDYLPSGSTGWHTHPGPVFITVLEGELTFYEYGDPNCTPVVVTAGNGYVDTGHGHIAINRTEQAAKDVSVIMAPVGQAFRGELDAPSPYCGF